MDFKYNINRLHVNLKNEFGEVKILEKFDIYNKDHFVISINKDQKEVKMIIEKTDIENYSFGWSYYANPISESNLVDRFSNVDSIVQDVYDIFSKLRFDQDYLNKLV